MHPQTFERQALITAGLRLTPQARTYLDLGGEGERLLHARPALLTGVVERIVAQWEVDLSSVTWHDVMLDITSWRDGLAPFRWRLVGTGEFGHTVALWTEEWSVREGPRSYYYHLVPGEGACRIEWQGRNASGLAVRDSVIETPEAWQRRRGRPSFLPA